MKLFKIGDISKICNISIKALRYYEALGLITPAEVDKYTGYRFYDQKNVEQIYTIQMLKDLNFSLDEIKNFSDISLDKKYIQIKKEIKELNKKLQLISSLKIQKGDGNMKCFVNDEKAIGKWKYICSTLSREAYNNGDFYEDKDALLQELYFLPNGEGYWIFDRWTEGILYHFGGRIYRYTIEDNKLYLEMYDDNQEFEMMLVFTKENSKEYKLEELERKDNVDFPFVCDDYATGYYQVYSLIKYKDKESFDGRHNKRTDLFLKSINLLPNGDCFMEFNNGRINKINWTKDFILNKNQSTASNYILKRINGEDYLIMDWKSGDYIYAGEINCCYVFKKVKNKNDNHEQIM